MKHWIQHSSLHLCHCNWVDDIICHMLSPSQAKSFKIYPQHPPDAMFSGIHIVTILIGKLSNMQVMT